jgi:hypothetical protein
MLMPGQPQQNLPPQVNSRDFLWIECKPAIDDKPCGWKNVLGEATERLQTAHPTRSVYLMIAIGWRCLFFLWDPAGAIQQAQLFVRPSNSNRQPWMIDPRIKVPLNGPWVDLATGEIKLNRAMTLECFSSVLANGQNVLSNQVSLDMIESMLVGVRATALQGLNPPHF